MEDTAVLALTMATLGQIGLTLGLLAARPVWTGPLLPLAAFFAASGIAVAGPAIAAFAPAFKTHAIALSLPAYLSMGPAFWLYVVGLTAEAPWRFELKLAWHFAPAAAGLVVAALIAALPLDVREAMFIDGKLVDEPFPAAVALIVFVLVLGWIVQSAYYAIRVFRQLGRYRRRLKDLFASNERRELRWIGYLLIVVGGVWLVAFATIVSENFFDRVLVGRAAGAGMALVLVWSLALWGLRQRPGFEGRYQEVEPVTEGLGVPEVAQGPKYQRSALGEEQALRIAAKIEAAMMQDRLYLDPVLSLHKLAKHLAISPNHISQTLNETVGQSFFDYINKWRIDAAKPRIQLGDETVLAIALSVGFNARSSFYKAFKVQTGQTPSEFARAARSGGSS